jgi:hypothetical protein
VNDNSKIENATKPSTPSKLELRRLLLEQFYEDSVGRHGSDHEQVRILSRLLVPTPVPGTNKRA